MNDLQKHSTDRKIIHMDCDCFYAAIEMRDNPNLIGKPMAVGGRSDRRGVIATCNYEARAFGVHSAMATSKALRLCPQLIVIRPRMDVYRQVSSEIHKIFAQYTHLIEPLSLDEAYLDVTNSEQCQGSATWIASKIRQQVEQSLGITISAGIAPNKFLAKIASDWNKPNGQFIVLPNQVADFVYELPVNKIHGVGKVTHKKMLANNLHTCADLQQLSAVELSQLFGRFGLRLYDLCRGIDDRPVRVSRVRKSLSVEQTFSHDLSMESALKTLPELFEKWQVRYQRALDKDQTLVIHTLFVKIKFNDFKQTTVDMRQDAIDIHQLENLLKKAYQRFKKPIRLIGIGVRFKTKKAAENDIQLPLL